MIKEEKTQLDPQIVERLNGFDWPALEASTGITREAVEKNPHIARQLAFGSMTDLIAGRTEDVSGFYSLRAIPGDAEKGTLGKIRAYTIEPEKKAGQTLFLFGSPIYSKKAIENLFEMTSIKTADKEGKEITVRVPANANAGVQVAVENENKEKTYYLVSIHQPTNRIIGVPVEAVEKMLAKASVYGVALNQEQKDALVQGKAVIVNGCTNKEGETFSACVQFDAAKRQLVNAHPSWLKEAQKAGIDTGVSTRAAAKKEVKETKKVEKTEKAAKTEKKPRSMKR